MKRIRIATRKSPLALWQANFIKNRLSELYPNMELELVTLTTKGDQILDSPLSKVGGKGLFVKELEVAMLEQRADLAVHSMKDVPMVLPEEFYISTICQRECATDALVSNRYQSIDELPLGAVVGTSSLRRQTQLKKLRPDLVIKDLRGNVGTRLSKLDNGDYDAILLASAGLMRLRLEERIATKIPVDKMLPAVGQGAVGIEIRKEDLQLAKLLEPLHCQSTAVRVKAERAMNYKLNGGCQVPIAGYAILKGEHIILKGMVANVQGTKFIHKEMQGLAEEAEELGTKMAEALIAAGAMELLGTMHG
ncbi:MAG: hydroxymethylbilane synthase [Gammaproteobacteria bacterium CG22_combo_CG10-13_8_21_14_all_40_8]|nr:MAG: hydroxymethylbilane synthase [Gammaproteobacteria bacterium CG22_combo_CG10-13_8_21_14_all_40_8]